MNTDQDVPGPSDVTIILTLIGVGLCMLTLLTIGVIDVAAYLLRHIHAAVAGL